MAKFLGLRLGWAAGQLLVVVVATFLLLRVLPVDPTSRIVGVVATDDARRQARVSLGIDASIWEQLTTFLSRLFLHADLGVSWTTGSAITSELKDYFPVTIQLLVLSFGVALAIAIPVGRAAASRRGGRTDRGTLVYGLFAGSQPDFWWGLMFIYLFYYRAHVAPAPLGLSSPELAAPAVHTHFALIDSLIDRDFHAFRDVMWHLMLPVLTLAFIVSGPIIKMTRQSVSAVADADYILFARALGLSKKTVNRYMLRNSLVPVVTLTGILFGFMLGGAVLIETVFSLNGIGVYALGRTLDTDFPAIQGAVIVMTAFGLAVYLIMDVLYALLDPRVRYGSSA